MSIAHQSFPYTFLYFLFIYFLFFIHIYSTIHVLYTRVSNQYSHVIPAVY